MKIRLAGERAALSGDGVHMEVTEPELLVGSREPHRCAGLWIFRLARVP